MAKGKRDAHTSVLTELMRDRRLAHAVFFKHRHPLATPAFHGDLIDDFHCQDRQVVDEAFRGGGKSTLGEEAMAIQGQFFDFANGVIVSSTEGRAIERLEAIKHELSTNESMLEVFGDQVGPIWQAHKIVMVSGVCMQALGVGQAVRGIKHHEFRPDYIWVDDMEDEESVKTPEASYARLKWLYGTLMPVCAKNARIRVTGNRLGVDAVVMKLANDPDWRARRVAITHTDFETGKEVATWPELYDMEWIEKKRSEYERLGMSQVWASEYMCEAMAENSRSFKPENIHVVPRVRTWQPTIAIWDPAKTSKNLRQQSHYAKVVVSWIGRKLIVWKAWGKPLVPSELLDDIFDTEVEFSPLSLNVEQDGLEEWLMQPLRLEQTKRRIMLPHLHGMRAPKDKDAFIGAMQPFFASNEIEFAEDMPELRAQLLNFPSGRKDIANALAYAFKLRPGHPIYDGFTEENIVEDLSPNLRSNRWLCLNGDGSYVTGALVQFDGTLSIVADWIEGGDTGVAVDTICKQAALTGGGKYDVVVPEKEVDQYRNKGIVAALKRLPREYRVGTDAGRGRAELQGLLGRRRDRPLVLCSDRASWTLRALAGGYHGSVDRAGVSNNVPDAGPYATLMEGLECFAGIMQHNDMGTDIAHQGGLYRESRGGVIYRSLIGTPLANTEDKASFLRGRT